jgi:hypothetical protein
MAEDIMIEKFLSFSGRCRSSLSLSLSLSLSKSVGAWEEEEEGENPKAPPGRICMWGSCMLSFCCRMGSFLLMKWDRTGWIGIGWVGLGFLFLFVEL